MAIQIRRKVIDFLAKDYRAKLAKLICCLMAHHRPPASHNLIQNMSSGGIRAGQGRLHLRGRPNLIQNV